MAGPTLQTALVTGRSAKSAGDAALSAPNRSSREAFSLTAVTRAPPEPYRSEAGDRARLALNARHPTREGLLAGQFIQALRNTGAVTLRDMTAALNQRGIRSARGGRWHVSSVKNLLARASVVPSSAALS
jgi:hypothetical protein